MGAVKTFPQLLVLRIIVGIFEGGLTPGVYFVISSWYVPAEQAKRAAFVLSAVLLGGAFGGIIAGAVTGGLEGRYGIRGWRWLFIVEGIITIIWAMIAGFILPDFPATCRHFTPEEKRIATSRLRNCGTNIGDNQSDGLRLGKVQSIKLALSDWRTWGVAGGIGVSDERWGSRSAVLTGRSYADVLRFSPTSIQRWSMVLATRSTSQHST